MVHHRLVLVALLALTSCHLGEVAMAPGVSVGYDPATRSEYLSVGATFAPPLRHDRAQWDQAFGRRNADVETIATLRATAATATDARSSAEEAMRAAQADLVAQAVVHDNTVRALTADRDRWQGLAEESDVRWFTRELLSTEWTTPKTVAISILGLLALGWFWMRRRKSGKEGDE